MKLELAEEFLCQLGHDLNASVRNFEMVGELLGEKSPRVTDAQELLAASLQQLKNARQQVAAVLDKRHLEEKNQGTEALKP